MANFKDWLFTEHFGDGGSSWDLLYPTTGGDYADVNGDPLGHFWLQWKWDRGTDPDIGRTLHNIDNDEFQRRGYTSISSRTMPDAGDGFWKHKPDDGKSSVEPYKLKELRWVVMGKTSKDTKFVDMDGAGKVRIWPEEGPTSVMDDTNLDAIFHDEDRHTHRWPTIDPKYMDSDWTKPEHKPRNLKESVLSFKQWLEYGGGGGAATPLMHGGLFGLPYKTTNDNMPVRSKYTTADGISKYGDDSRPRTDKHGNPSSVDTEWIGKKRTPLSKRPRERQSMWIDKNRRSVPTRDDRPDIVY